MTNNHQKENNVSGMEFFLVWLLVCLPKDISDPILDMLGGIGIILNRITTVIVMIILGLWALLRLKKFPVGSFFSSSIGDMIPGLGAILPAWSGWILYVYAKQKIGEKGMKVIRK